MHKQFDGESLENQQQILDLQNQQVKKNFEENEQELYQQQIEIKDEEIKVLIEQLEEQFKQKQKTNKQKRPRNSKKENQMNQDKYYNDHQSGNELVDNCIDIIRHYQNILDNQDHLEQYNYNNELMKLWRRQLNLLDTYDRFCYYKQLFNLKQLLRKLKLLEANIFESLFLNKLNEELVHQIDELILNLKIDLNQQEDQFDVYKLDINILIGMILKQNVIHLNVQMMKKTKKFLIKIQGTSSQKTLLIEKVLLFILKLIAFEVENITSLNCYLCQQRFKTFQELLDHIQKEHLKFLTKLLLGKKDLCFNQECRIRKNNVLKEEKYNLRDHLKFSHSQIYEDDKILSYIYDLQDAKNHYYGKDLKNVREKFDNHLCDWINIVDPWSMELINNNLKNLQGKKRLSALKNWLRNDISFQKCEVDGCFGTFDQLCYMLKVTWSVFSFRKKVR